MNKSDPTSNDPASVEEVETPADEVEIDASDANAAELLLALVDEAAARRADVAEPRPDRVDGVVVGRLVALTEDGPKVAHRYAASVEGDLARAMAVLGAGDVGRAVAILFENGSPDRPIVMGLMHEAERVAKPRVEAAESESNQPERLVFEAGREIVLKCGDASITLTRAGKILIRGAYVLTRASSVNRIQGGSVEIN